MGTATKVNMTKLIELIRISMVLLVVLLVTISTNLYAQNKCSFKAPKDWIEKKTHWNGQCSDGYANGLGILKEFENGKVKRFFFGKINKGEIEFGVIDQPDGYTAGKFSDGIIVPSDDRQTYIDAFNVAKKAAIKAANNFRKIGNKASAQFYENKAKELYNQMD
ncbi:MAG TPA: hypothetical protein PLV19_01435 [Nitrosomonas sp.]|nr:hypothetical protein [Nitrosomonas sp.]HRB32824.1 hypothetical protein [Nitrosomonas sp.]HRB77500.1 hypothetical protein [Nitrosomonas sp.]